MPDDDARDASDNASDRAAQDRLEKDVSAVKDDIAHLGQKIADAVNALAGMAQRRAKRRYKNARANVDSVMSEHADGVAEAAQSAAASVGESLEEIIQERPLAAVAVALGLGFLIGMTWRR
jgi:ElaB/YqjD/DUF883 family membrane-anchored ribosome-binding protein